MSFLTPDAPQVQAPPPIVKKASAEDILKKKKSEFRRMKGRGSTISAGTLTAAAPTMKKTLGSA